jgi:hypothetical protein
LLAGLAAALGRRVRCSSGTACVRGPWDTVGYGPQGVVAEQGATAGLGQPLLERPFAIACSC